MTKRKGLRDKTESQPEDPVVIERLLRQLVVDDATLVAAAAQLAQAEERVAWLRDHREKVRLCISVLGYDPDAPVALQE
jgi:hypothetical protein